VSIEVTVSEEAITIGLHGLDWAWALKRSLRVPLASVQAVSLVGAEQARSRLRWLGTRLPGLVLAGRFSVGGAPVIGNSG
jgi:hypothetical protein